MGGLAREMNLLVQASRCRDGQEVASTSLRSSRIREKYARLLDVLELGFSIDVLSGTSAGGINAALLGLANVWHSDLGRLRDLWLEEGSLARLLRDPADRDPPSLLYGDRVLLKGLRGGLAAVIDRSPAPPVPGDPTRVLITTTLLTGEESRFTDDFGTLVLLWAILVVFLLLPPVWTVVDILRGSTRVSANTRTVTRKRRGGGRQPGRRG